MTLLSWNCQGLGRALTARNLRDMIRKYRPSIIFLMETKINSDRIKRLRLKCGFECDLYVEPRGLSGGLAVWWSASISLTVLYKSRNIIHVVVDTDCLGLPKYISFVYGPPKEGERRTVWNTMKRLVPSVDDSWLAMGDFNDLLSQSEKEGGNPRSIRKIMNFQSLLSSCDLLDLEFKGSAFTWCNKRGDGIVHERLDWALGNVAFRNEFDRAIVFHVDPVGSDHHALVLDCCYIDDKAPRSFKFEASWTQHADFISAVDLGWNGVGGDASNKIQDLIRRLEACRKKLVEWSRREFPNFRKVIDHLRNELNCCYTGPFDAEKLVAAESLVKQIEKAWGREEAYWWQRSRITWLKCGDRNTSFFHSSVIQRRQRNKILRLRSDAGIWLEDKKEIHEIFSSYYKNLFSSGGPRLMDQALLYVKEVVTADDNCLLTQPVLDQEIEAAVFQLGAAKAPGPDGLSAIFYQSAWQTVNREVCAMVHDFFEGKAGVGPLHDTNIVLLPKIEKPDDVKHFRPIGLCNVSYKIIAKIMTNRMRLLMDKIISPNQRAFVAGRMIQDNIILVHEAFHYLKHKKKGSKWEFALKIDMNKAYDRIEWDFLAAVMLRMGFCRRWVSWVMECITSVAFHLKINGRPVSSFKPERGIRQGDPLSPYMFIIVSEVLSLMLQMHIDKAELKGIKLARSAPTLSHCFFADDAVLFLKADELNCKVLRMILGIYCKASGQLINLDKSSLYFSANTPTEVKERVAACLGVTYTDSAGKYLGLPTIWGRSKAGALAFVRDKIGLKLKGWKQKLLTFAGRETLIKAVANSIPTYPMTCFLFPKKSCIEIDRLVSRFWWGQAGETRSIHWRSWNRMTSRKGEGGMGFRDLLCFNKALLAKTA
ncbi:hypothetical protein QN277_009512 [Acacia crassicarpa]|uniref:Reverse transcriptase domain-containing protein n=1 Tax=Acacia crassicarpa TaxID=499986 RepID=A0AAE1IR86_9FABA|nr:hypothetical protein QN277_009512 [Acacia crassicarpa]